MKTLSLKLPEPLFAVLSAAASKRGESRSTLVREAIEAYVAAEQPVLQTSCLDRARDIAGTIEGPVDLSTNPDHLTGYGR